MMARDVLAPSMAAALVGDDVFGEDPTVDALEERSARLFEKEAALLVTHRHVDDAAVAEALARIRALEPGRADEPGRTVYG